MHIAMYLFVTCNGRPMHSLPVDLFRPGTSTKQSWANAKAPAVGFSEKPHTTMP